MTKPPPTPSKPDSKPATLPVATSLLVQCAVQNNLEVAGFNKQAGGGLFSLSYTFLKSRFHMRVAI